MENKESNLSRKKFLGWAGVLSVAAIAGGKLFFSKKEEVKIAEKKTVKMLTQDGKLVEIDASLIAGNGKKVSDKELQEWVSSK